MERIVVIPALNPDEHLREVVEKNWERENMIIVVDDGSKEEYDQFFWELSEKCIVLHHRENKGKGEAIKTALRYIKKELWGCGLIGVMDADGQHLPEDMEKLFLKAAANPDALILGCRTVDHKVPWKSRVGNQMTQKVFQIITGVRVSDTQTGLRAFSSRLLDFMLEIPGERYEYEMNVLLTCARKRIPIIEVTVQTIYHDKNNSCSHFRKVKDSIRIYQKLLKFSLVSFSSFLVDYMTFVFLLFLLPNTAAGLLTANISARGISAVYNYRMNCRYVFQEKKTAKTALEYLVLAGSILLLNNMILQFLVFFFSCPVYPAKIITEALLFLFSWIIQKQIIFRKTELYWRKSRRSGEFI